ncbi:reverse transcriptase domain-containing protein [Tanacetum coccineum]
MEMAEIEMREMEIQMRMVEVIGLLVENAHTRTSWSVNHSTSRERKEFALTWWNSHKRTIGTEAVFVMSWRELIKLMTEVYCLRNEIQKMESELWNLTVMNNDLAAYT